MRNAKPARPGPRNGPAVMPLALLLALLLALTACSAGEGESARPDAAGPAEHQEAAPEQERAPDAAPEQESEEDADTGQRAAEAGPQHVVRNARVTVVTADVPGQYAKAVALTEEAGGYVSAELTEQHSEGYERSRVTLRVPPQQYAGLLAQLSALGELHRREISTEDVTDQVVDVESRIATQEESVARVRELMEEARSLDDVVALEEELSKRQAALESLKARQASLRERTGMATVTLELVEEHRPEEEEDEEEEGSSGGPSVSGAVVGGWQAFLASLLWVAAVTGAVLPFVLTLLLVVVAVPALRRQLPARVLPPRWRRPAPDEPPAGPVPPPAPPGPPAPGPQPGGASATGS
ncbi:DUF4349 domain-containing protein [Streptomyces sp. ACA25]|uniref:DUF4349 domain-containing protein n=1 Tax=Streptomyces sp. ACA25 TaxID=3022596 RepID=UPI0023076919|nr:DUF4349 domain-containing protein [Streptomyces sp. ACA25]MDB1089160.1 DUF4349 domain-containing protein [Streptomyces sp. ACA25]